MRYFTDHVVCLQVLGKQVHVSNLGSTSFRPYIYTITIIRDTTLLFPVAHQYRLHSMLNPLHPLHSIDMLKYFLSCILAFDCVQKFLIQRLKFSSIPLYFCNMYSNLLWDIYQTLFQNRCICIWWVDVYMHAPIHLFPVLLSKLYKNSMSWSWAGQWKFSCCVQENA